jgi:3-hydroxyacyl-[acyl-carrier-protein] dehydratase
MAMIPEGGLRIDADGILRLLPHRYPFLLVDRAFIQEKGKRGYGVKNITFDEPFFAGHFPGNPVVPGVIIAEALAQTIAVIYGSAGIGETGEIPEVGGNVGYLASVNLKFTRLVSPGDQLLLRAALVQKIKGMSMYDVEASVDGDCAAKGTISVTERGGDK